MDFGLKNKTALVTGGASGVGKGIVTILAQEGCNIVIGDLRYSDESKAYLSALASENNVRIECFEIDVTKEECAKNIFAFALDKFENVDILVNCAGLGRRQNFSELSTEDWHLIQNVNLNGPFFMSREYAHICKEKNFAGNIVNVLSKSAYTTSSKDTTSYVSAKAGLVGLTRGMANELIQWNIRVNGVVPGYVQGEKSYPDGDPKTEEIRKRLPLKKFATPIEIGRVVAFLASDVSSQCVGSCIDCTGGTML